jgi:hypothetical protein
MSRGQRKPEQIDLFTSDAGGAPPGSPEWRTLPEETRTALTTLLVQLITDHAQTGRHDGAGGSSDDV